MHIELHNKKQNYMYLSPVTFKQILFSCNMQEHTLNLVLYILSSFIFNEVFIIFHSLNNTVVKFEFHPNLCFLSIS